jgi:hypothetical protein
MHFNELCDTVRTLTGVDIRKNKTREREVVTAKQAVVNILVRPMGMKLVQAGKLLGYDHSTVIHHRDGHIHRYRYDKDYAALYDRILILAAPYMRPVDESELNEVLSNIKKIGN